MTPLPDETIRIITDFVGSIALPFKGNFSFNVLDRKRYEERSGGMFEIVSPHYLMFYGDRGDDNVLRNIGFAGELAALKMAEMDIGTCWLGGPKSKETLDDSEYVICLSFGRPAEKFRMSESEAVRNSLADIASNYTPEQEALLRYVRLAPSARNLQPWFFRCDGDRIHVFKTKSKGIMTKLAIFKMLQKIDIGIAISHFTATPFIAEDDPQSDKGMQYECTLRF